MCRYIYIYIYIYISSSRNVQVREDPKGETDPMLITDSLLRLIDPPLIPPPPFREGARPTIGLYVGTNFSPLFTRSSVHRLV